jgi:hypothetical protein
MIPLIVGSQSWYLVSSSLKQVPITTYLAISPVPWRQTIVSLLCRHRDRGRDEANMCFSLRVSYVALRRPLSALLGMQARIMSPERAV